MLVEWVPRQGLPDRPDWLTREERTRRDRQPSELGRAWAAARCWVRGRLAEHLGCGPDQVGLSTDRWGRPRLLNGPPGLDLNVSHTETVLVLALAPAAVGVDVEDLPDDPDLLRTAGAVASPRELDELLSVACGDGAGAVQQTFHRWWVRKEAVLKAQGRGFLTDPRQVHVGTLDVPEPPVGFRVVDLGQLPTTTAPRLAVALGGSRSVDGLPWDGPQSALVRIVPVPAP